MSDTIANIIAITIGVNSIGVQTPGFGIPLILSSTAAWTERIRFYTDTAGVLVDFAATTPEYLMAVALFSQVVQPTRIAIGRCANKPTQKYSLVPTVTDLAVYKVKIGATTYTFTAGSSTTNDLIVDGLVTLINAGSGDTTTASAVGSTGSHVLTLTANAAGNWDAVSVLNPDLLSITQDHADPGLAADIAAIALEDNSWYFILYPFTSKACALIISAYAEANKKFYLATSSDSNNITLALGGDSTTSLMGQAKTSAYKRTAVLYHPDPASFAASAWAGRVGPLDPGSETWWGKNLAGVAVVQLTGTHRTNIEAKNGNYYESVSGVGIVRNGMGSSGQYIDLTRFLDWLEATMGAGIFGHMAAVSKIPFTDKGAAVVQGDVDAALRAGVKVGGISEDPPFATSVGKVKDVSSANKALRILPDVKFAFTYASAIQKVQVTGVVSI